MGSFSWNKADNLTQIENVAYNTRFKFLIPEEFGGGYIKDRYQGYGYLATKGNGRPKYDMYELLAFWNKENNIPFEGVTVESQLQYDGKEIPPMKEIDGFTDKNRRFGIAIGCYNHQIDRLKYPLKLVSCSYKGTYEDCFSPSYRDPDQGFFERKRGEFSRYV